MLQVEHITTPTARNAATATPVLLAIRATRSPTTTTTTTVTGAGGAYLPVRACGRASRLRICLFAGIVRVRMCVRHVQF
jgi:hypothetical protein